LLDPDGRGGQLRHGAQRHDPDLGKLQSPASPLSPLTQQHQPPPRSGSGGSPGASPSTRTSSGSGFRLAWSGRSGTSSVDANPRRQTRNPVNTTPRMAEVTAARTSGWTTATAPSPAAP